VGTPPTTASADAWGTVSSWLAYSVGYKNANGGWAVIPFLVGIIVAGILIAIYLALGAVRT
jgi:uncharacterized membrane protein